MFTEHAGLEPTTLRLDQLSLCSIISGKFADLPLWPFSSCYFKLKNTLNDELSTGGVLESLTPHEIGKQFGTFVSGFLSSLSVVKTRKVFTNKKHKKYKKRKK